MEPKWLELARADLAAGVKEIPGRRGHPRIIEMYDNAGLAHNNDDTESWCGCAVGTWLKESGLPTPANFYGAKQFETYGVPSAFKPGAIAVFYRTALRERDWRRHVTIAVEETPTHYVCLGGNQGDAVKFSKFPKRDLSAMRWPVAATAPALREAGSTDVAASDQLIRWGGASILAAAGTQAAPTVQAPAVPPTPTVESLQELGLMSNLMKAVMEGAYAAIAVYQKNVWISTVILGLVMGYVGWRIRQTRIERAKRGDPLSSQKG